MMKASIVMTMFLLVMLVAQGCGKAEMFGEFQAERDVTSISDILADPGKYADEPVKITGKIINECPSGCWFDVGVGQVVVRVDIEPAGLAIPQRVGKTVVVEGKIEVKNNMPKLMGNGVEIK
jgi:hypothetical protein